MTSQFLYARRCLATLACGAMVLGVSACGSSTPANVSPAVRSKLERTLEQAHLSAAQATEVTNCLVPTLKRHSISTLAAANAYDNRRPAWLKTPEQTCFSQVGLTVSNDNTPNTTARVASSPAVTATEPADVQACRRLQRAFVAFRAAQTQVNEAGLIAATLPDAEMTQTLFNAFQALNGDLENAELTHSQDKTAQPDEQSVATDCAAAGVDMPPGFTG